MAQAKIYNADEVTVLFGPVLLDSGHADGEFVRIEQESDDFEDVVGAAGEVAVSRTNDRRATVTIILLQTAIENDQLSAISNLAKDTPAGIGGFHPLQVRDRNGRSVYKAEKAWIMRPPDPSFDRTATSREWTFRVAELVRTDGGNNPLL